MNLLKWINCIPIHFIGIIIDINLLQSPSQEEIMLFPILLLDQLKVCAAADSDVHNINY